MSEYEIPATNTLSIRIPNSEADDIIAMFCYLFPKEEKQILSSDRDLLQLITSTTSVYNFMASIESGKVIDYEWVDENYGDVDSFKFRYLLEKAMIGDKSDNLPKIDLISDKTAKSYAKQIFDKYGVCNLSDIQKLDFLQKPPRANKKGLENLINNFPLVTNNYKIMDLYYAISEKLDYIDKIHGKLASLASFEIDYWTGLDKLDKIDGLSSNRFMSSFESIVRSNNCVDRKRVLNEFK